GTGSQLQVSSLDRNGTLIARAIYAPENASRLEAAFKAQIARAVHDGFTPEELRAAKAGWLQSRQVGRAQDAELAGRLTTLSFLARTFAWDGQLERRVEALTAADIRAVLERYVYPGKISIVKAGDFSKTAAR